MLVKLGSIRLATGKDKAILGEMGSTGTVIFSGILSETGEYLSDFKPGDKQKEIIEKMRRSDGQVKAGLLALTLPILSAHWDIEAASKESRDLEIAEFVRYNIFENMTITWNDFLRQALLKLPFGYSVFEKVWELRDGKYYWKKLAPRLPKTIARWHVDADGELDKVEQWVWKSETFKTVDIPVEKLLVFTHEREGSNFEGISVLRAAYKHWYYKNTLYAIDGIAAERHGVGVAHFSYPATATTDQKKAIEAIGQRLHANERAYVATPEGITFDLKGVTGQLYDIKGSIEHHDQQILRSILAQFISLGSRSGGSYALSQDQSDFFLMALRATAKEICDTINIHGIRQLVDYNFQTDKYPKLAVSDLDYVDVVKLSQAINQLASAGALTMDDGIEIEMRRIMHLPPLKGPSDRRVTGVQPPPKVLKDKRIKGRDFWRDPTDAEKHIAFTEIADRLDKTQADLVTAAKHVQDKQIATIVKMAVEDLEKGDVNRIVTIDIPFRKEMAAAIEGCLTDLYDYGRRQVQTEAMKQGVSTKGKEKTPANALELIKARALAIANVLSSKLRAALTWEALDQVTGANVNRSMLVQVLTSLSDRELETAARINVNQAFNLGRAAQAEELRDSIARTTSSALMDDNTCGYCRGVDGKSWAYGEEPMHEPPYDDCDGRDYCRCLWVYTFKSELPSLV